MSGVLDNPSYLAQFNHPSAGPQGKISPLIYSWRFIFSSSSSSQAPSWQPCQQAASSAPSPSPNSQTPSAASERSSFPDGFGSLAPSSSVRPLTVACSSLVVLLPACLLVWLPLPFRSTSPRSRRLRFVEGWCPCSSGRLLGECKTKSDLA